MWFCWNRCPFSSGTENYASNIARHFSQPRFVAEGDIVPVPITVVPSILDGCGNIPVDVIDDIDEELSSVESVIVCSDSKLSVHDAKQQKPWNAILVI